MQTLLNLAPGSSIINQYSSDMTLNPTDSAQDMKIDDFLEHSSEQKMTPRLRMLSKVKRTYESKLAEGEPLDVHEQQELIDDVRSQNAFITDLWAKVLNYLGILLIAVMGLFSSLLVVFGPSYVGFHRRFSTRIGVPTMHILQILSMISYIAVYYYAKRYPHSSEDRFLVATVTTVVSVSLSVILLIIRGWCTLETLWMPAFTLIYYFAALLAFRSKNVIYRDIAELEKCRYKYTSL